MFHAPAAVGVDAQHRNAAIEAAKALMPLDYMEQPCATAEELAEFRRQLMREQFMKAKVAISGANFGVAETGTINSVESEGNGRMCLTLGADPVATSVMHADGRVIDAFVVSKEAKKHGMQRRIEGFDVGVPGCFVRVSSIVGRANIGDHHVLRGGAP